MFLPNCHWNLPRFPQAEQVRLLEPEEASEPAALPQRGAEVDVAGPLLDDRKGDVDVLSALGRGDVRRRQRLEEPEVHDVLVAPDQQLPVEHRPRKDDDGASDDRLVGDVVAEDDDPVDRGRRAFVDAPPEVDGRGPVVRNAAALLGDDPGVDVAGVEVEILEPIRGRFPGRPVEGLLADRLAGLDGRARHRTDRRRRFLRPNTGGCRPGPWCRRNRPGLPPP